MKRFTQLIVSASCLLFSAVVWAKELPPTGSQPKDFNLPKTTSFSLDNGLGVTFIEYGKTPKATLRLVTNTGNMDDGDMPWVSDMGYDLLKQGTQSRSATEIAELAASMGGEVQTWVTMNSSVMQMDVLSEFAADAANLMSDILINSVMPENDFNRLKKDYLRNLQVQLSDPGSIASEAFYKAVYGNHAYGVSLPTDAQLNAMTLQQVRQFMADNVLPNRSHLYVSGVFDHQTMKQAISQQFAQWQAGEGKSMGAILTQSGPKLIMLERKDAPQSTIRLGLAAVAPNDADYLTFQIMNTLLGGAFSSRITSNIREDKGYTYSPNSSVSGRVNSGVWYQAADITAESTGAALAEVLKEITRLSNEPPAKAELDGIKNYMSGIFVLQNSSRAGIIGILSYMKQHGLTDDYLKSYVARVHATTAEEISAVAKKYLDPKKMILVVVGDKAQVAPQLKAVPALQPLIN